MVLTVNIIIETRTVQKRYVYKKILADIQSSKLWSNLTKMASDEKKITFFLLASQFQIHML